MTLYDLLKVTVDNTVVKVYDLVHNLIYVSTGFEIVKFGDFKYLEKEVKVLYVESNVLKVTINVL